MSGVSYLIRSRPVNLPLVLSEIIAVNIIHIAIGIIIHPRKPISLRLIHPHIVGQFPMVPLHRPVHHGHYELRVRSAQAPGLSQTYHLQVPLLLPAFQRSLHLPHRRCPTDSVKLISLHVRVLLESLHSLLHRIERVEIQAETPVQTKLSCQFHILRLPHQGRLNPGIRDIQATYQSQTIPTLPKPAVLPIQK